MADTIVEVHSASNGRAGSQPENSLGPVQLAMFQRPEAKSAAWVVDRTARYAKDPTAYLQETLGQQQFVERRSAMCISDIDRDHYGTGKHKQRFEEHIATMLGKRHGLFFMTGVQAQLIALKIYCDRRSNNRVAWHVTSHLETAEEESWKHLYGLDRILLGRNPEENPTVEAVVEALALPKNKRPAVILLELPNRSLGCKTYTFDELCKISEECRKADCRLHLDGARLWEVEPHYQATAGKTFADICGLFDSVYISFYKGLGGLGGAILALDDETMVSEARKWQRRAGGNLFTSLAHVIDDERGFNENIGSFSGRRNKMIDVVEGIKAATRDFKTEGGQPYLSFCPDSATCCQIHMLFHHFSADQLNEARDKVDHETNIRVFEKIWPKKSHGDVAAGPLVLEWSIIGATENVNTEVFVEGYTALCKELQLIEQRLL